MFLKVEVKFLKAERLQERYEELLHAFHPDPQFLIFCDMFFFPFFSSLHYIHTHTHTHTHTPFESWRVSYRHQQESSLI